MAEPSGGMNDDGDTEQQASTSARPQINKQYVYGNIRYRPVPINEMKDVANGSSTEARSSNPFSGRGNGVTKSVQLLSMSKQWKKTYAEEGLDEDEVRREQQARDANRMMRGLALVQELGTPQYPKYVITKLIVNPSTSSTIPIPSSSFVDPTPIRTRNNVPQAASTYSEGPIIRPQSNGSHPFSTSAHAVTQANGQRSLNSGQHMRRTLAYTKTIPSESGAPSATVPQRGVQPVQKQTQQSLPAVKRKETIMRSIPTTSASHPPQLSSRLPHPSADNMPTTSSYVQHVQTIGLKTAPSVNNHHSSNNLLQRGVGGGVPVSRPLEAVSSHQVALTEDVNQELNEARSIVSKKTREMLMADIEERMEEFDALPEGSKALFHHLHSAVEYDTDDNWLHLSAFFGGETTAKQAIVNRVNMQQHVNLNDNDLDSALEGPSQPNQGLQPADDRSNTAVEDEETNSNRDSFSQLLHEGVEEEGARIMNQRMKPLESLKKAHFSDDPGHEEVDQDGMRIDEAVEEGVPWNEMDTSETPLLDPSPSISDNGCSKVTQVQIDAEKSLMEADEMLTRKRRRSVVLSDGKEEEAQVPSTSQLHFIYESDVDDEEKQKKKRLVNPISDEKHEMKEGEEQSNSQNMIYVERQPSPILNNCINHSDSMPPLNDSGDANKSDSLAAVQSHSIPHGTSIELSYGKREMKSSSASLEPNRRLLKDDMEQCGTAEKSHSKTITVAAKHIEESLEKEKADDSANVMKGKRKRKLPVDKTQPIAEESLDGEIKRTARSAMHGSSIEGVNNGNGNEFKPKQLKQNRIVESETMVTTRKADPKPVIVNRVIKIDPDVSRAKVLLALYHVLMDMKKNGKDLPEEADGEFMMRLEELYKKSLENDSHYIPLSRDVLQENTNVSDLRGISAESLFNVDDMGNPVMIASNSDSDVVMKKQNLPFKFSILAPLNVSLNETAKSVIKKAAKRKEAPYTNEVFEENLMPLESPKCREIVPGKNTYSLTPHITVSNPEEAFSSNIEPFCNGSHPMVLFSGFMDALNMGKSLFSTETLAEKWPKKEMDVREQYTMAVEENVDEKGNPTWKCKSSISTKKNKKISIAEMKVEQERSFLAALREEKTRMNSPETVSEMKMRRERKILKFGTNLDLNEKEFPDHYKAIRKLPGFLRVEDQNCNLLSLCNHAMAGVNRLQMYLKVPGNRTPAHTENNLMASVNLNNGPGDCEWISIPYEYWGHLNEQLVAKRIKFTDSWWWDSGLLLSMGIPVYRITQKAGDLVYVAPGCMHMVQATGWCNNVAWNVGPINHSQLSMALHQYEWNKATEYKSVVPIVNLIWALAERKELMKDEKIRSLVKGVLIRTLAYRQMVADWAIATQEKKKFEYFQRKKGVDVPYCDGLKCEAEIFSIAFERYDEGKRVIHCAQCAKKGGYTDYNVVEESSLKDLKKVFDGLVVSRKKKERENVKTERKN